MFPISTRRTISFIYQSKHRAHYSTNRPTINPKTRNYVPSSYKKAALKVTLLGTGLIAGYNALYEGYYNRIQVQRIRHAGRNSLK